MQAIAVGVQCCVRKVLMDPRDMHLTRYLLCVCSLVVRFVLFHLKVRGLL